MAHLIPHFIYQQHRQHRQTGQLSAATLFLDVVGFTALTQALMEHGKEGAEVMANVINQVFAPMINIIASQGGFISGFAGDAFTAIFPQPDHIAVHKAVQTALFIQQSLNNQQNKKTPWGSFTLNVRQSLAYGQLTWGIVGTPQQNAYYFAGSALNHCYQAQTHAQKGDITCHPSLLPYLKTSYYYTNDQKAVYYLRDNIPLPSHIPTPPPIPHINIDHVISFFPAPLWQTAYQGEFKQVAILFLSFEGEPTWEQLNGFANKVMHHARVYDGHFTEIDFSDKGGLILLYFGAPITHEEDIIRALNFLHALQEDVNPPIIRWRAGLTYGSVYTGLIGTQRRGKYAALGTTVNLAARLMTDAQWGQILVSQKVAQTHSFNFDYLGDFHYKGFSQMKPTYQLIGRNDARRHQALTDPIVGRRQEISQLRQFAQFALTHNEAATIIIYGEAGIGKSRLAQEISHDFSVDNKHFLASTDPFVKQPLNPFLYYIKNYFQQSVDASHQENTFNFARALTRLLLRLEQANAPVNINQELMRLQSVFGVLAGLQWELSLYDRDAHLHHHNTLTAFATLLRAESYLQPIIFEIDDIHWLDDASQELLLYLTHELNNIPIIFLLTARYANEEEALKLPFKTKQLFHIELKPLTDDALRQQAEHLLQGPISPELHDFLLAKSQANPLFTQQILYYCQKNQLLQRNQANAWELDGQGIKIPSSINAILVARIDRLPANTKQMIQFAAVLGREFDLPILKQMLDYSDIDLTNSINQAIQEQIWLPLGPERYTFKHTLLLDAAYDMQLRRHLRRRHQQAAHAIETLYTHDLTAHYPDLIYHYGRAQNTEQKKFYAYQAGAHASQNGAQLDAVHYLSQALNLTPQHNHQDRFDLLLLREKAYHLLSERTKQADDLVALEKLASRMSFQHKADVALRQAGYATSLGQYTNAITHAQQGIALAQTTHHNPQIAQGYYLWGYVLWRQGDYNNARQRFKKGLMHAHLAQQKSIAAKCLRGIGNVAWNMGQYLPARLTFHQALRLQREIGDRWEESVTLNNLGITAKDVGQFTRALNYLNTALTIKEELGDQMGKSLIINNLALLHWQIGQAKDAYKMAHQAYQISSKINDQWGASNALLTLASLDSDNQNLAQAQQNLEKALAMKKEMQDKRGQSLALFELGLCYTYQNLPYQAMMTFQQALLLHQDIFLRHHVCEDWAGLAYVAWQQDEKERAYHYTKQIIAYHQENPSLFGCQRPARVWHTCLPILNHFNPEQALNCLDQAYHWLQERAQQLPSTAYQNSFWQNHPIHKQIQYWWQTKIIPITPPQTNPFPLIQNE
ncbi:MAG TPA: adenylate/guanylate cyclase domain-containing protein [Anaerolineae bacterium]|nr:adenylate/guanylate cyclase domain-containing protein [Anaerolineae bacterium]